MTMNNRRDGKTVEKKTHQSKKKFIIIIVEEGNVYEKGCLIIFFLSLC